MTFLLDTLFGLSFLIPYAFAQDHTQCADSGSDWYTSFVGETPCRTYERLRLICNSTYALGALNPSTPPDVCGDQIADCCCNSIAFGLSMMCLTCQQGMGPNGFGIDAGAGTYELYLMHGSNSFCTPNTNLSFPIGIQAAVCDADIKIHDNFYDRLFWGDGTWFYTTSRNIIEARNVVEGNNTFTHCASTTLNVTSSSQSQSMSLLESTPLSKSTPLLQSTSFSLSSITSLTESSAASTTSASTLPHSSKSLTAGAIAGIAVGSIAFVGAIALFLIWMSSYRRRQADIADSETSPTPFTISDTPSMSNGAGIPVLTRNPESGAWRRLRTKEQREPPPRYTE
ncbi:hypothetical protein ARMSODRAFT_963658 [Armillaria solidipes]|uniref:Cyanovirin-N domain-containing protein n=1 Tax=Armillaria solidipes TaxID=1076256 RepID=A0A2H3BAN1_9AGAR|nr:hypothetical protein ARMSODRAFT_963658 [Armillaria solidipes]